MLGQAGAKVRGAHLGRSPIRIDEEEVQGGYQALRSQGKVTRLHRCWARAIRRILHGARQLKWSGQEKNSHNSR